MARLVGVHRKSWAQAIIGRIRPSCRVERAIRGKGRVARPMWHGTTFSQRERKTVLAICAKKLTKLPSGGLNRGPSPSNPQQMPLGWPKRPPKTAHFCSSIFLCQCHKVGPSIGVAAGTATLLARHSIGAFVTQRKKNLCAIIECKFVKQIVAA